MEKLVIRKRKFLFTDSSEKGYTLVTFGAGKIESSLLHVDTVNTRLITVFDRERLLVFTSGKFLLLETITGSIIKEHKLKSHFQTHSIVGYLVVYKKFIFNYQRYVGQNCSYIYRLNPTTTDDLLSPPEAGGSGEVPSFQEKSKKINGYIMEMAIFNGKIVISGRTGDFEEFNIQVLNLSLKVIERIKVGLDMSFSNLIPWKENKILLYTTQLLSLREDEKTEIRVINIKTGEIQVKICKLGINSIQVYPNGKLLINSTLDNHYMMTLSEEKEEIALNFIHVNALAPNSYRGVKTLEGKRIKILDNRSAEIFDNERLLLIKKNEKILDLEVAKFISYTSEFKISIPNKSIEKIIPIPLSKVEQEKDNERLYNLFQPLIPLPKDLLLMTTEFI